MTSCLILWLPCLPCRDLLGVKVNLSLCGWFLFSHNEKNVTSYRGCYFKTLIHWSRPLLYWCCSPAVAGWKFVVNSHTSFLVNRSQSEQQKHPGKLARFLFYYLHLSHGQTLCILQLGHHQRYYPSLPPGPILTRRKFFLRDISHLYFTVLNFYCLACILQAPSPSKQSPAFKTGSQGDSQPGPANSFRPSISLISAQA